MITDLDLADEIMDVVAPHDIVTGIRALFLIAVNASCEPSGGGLRRPITIEELMVFLVEAISRRDAANAAALSTRS